MLRSFISSLAYNLQFFTLEYGCLILLLNNFLQYYLLFITRIWMTVENIKILKFYISRYFSNWVLGVKSDFIYFAKIV